MDYRWTRKGVIIEVTNSINGLLEQGGVCGEEEFYRDAQLQTLGIQHGTNLNTVPDGEACTRLERIRYSLTPRILRRGVRIQ